jgi:Na+-transporting NADH:ubiquinone oxidoreductase subunit NqrF
LVLNTHAQALESDEKNRDTKWQDSGKTEMEQLAEYKIFVDKGVGGQATARYKEIRCHMIMMSDMVVSTRII